MRKEYLIMFVLLAFMVSGCSRKFVAISLDEAISTTWHKLGEAKCKNKVPIASEKPSATYQVQTAYKLSMGAPAGAIPIVLSGESSLTESTAVTVKFDLSEYECADFKIEAAKPSTMYSYNPDKGTIEPLEKLPVTK